MRRQLLFFTIILPLIAGFLFYYKPESHVYAYPSETSDDWPIFGHDPRHTGFSLSSAPRKPILVWKFGSISMKSSPAVVDGRVFVGASHWLLCLNETDGKLIWSYRTDDASGGGDITSSPAVFEDRVFFGSKAGDVYSLNATSGVLIWKYETSGIVDYSSPVVINGRVFIVIYWYGHYYDQGYLYALNATSGTYIWRSEVFQIDTHDAYSSPAVADGRVFVGIGGRVCSLNETTGERIWTYVTEASVGRSSPVVVNGRVFVGSLGYWLTAKVYSINATTGKQIWNYTTPSRIDSSPAVANGRVSIASEDGNIYSLNETTGANIWTYKASPRIISNPAVANGMILIGESRKDGRLMALNETTGELVWSYVVGDIGTSSPAVSNGKVFVGTSEGIVCVGSPISMRIDPVFKDNVGRPLYVKPSFWTVQLPNGTLRVLSVPTTYNQTQAGDYSITSIIWKGTEVIPTISPSISIYENAEWTPSINCRLPTRINISLSTTSTYAGFKATITGNLTCNESALSGFRVLLEYTITEGKKWETLTAVTTGKDGGYLAEWMPSATGNYIVRATWSGNDTYPSSNSAINIAVTPAQEKYVFSVSSNSTVSDFAFNSTGRKLVFAVSGPSGTKGFAKVTIAKDLISNIANLKVYIDAAEIHYSASSTGDLWVVYFTYQHSVRYVTVSLGPTPSEPFITTPLIVTITGVTAISLIAILIIFKKRALRLFRSSRS